MTLDAICAELGRDPATLARSAGVSVRPLEPANDAASAITGPPERIADAIRTFRDAGYTQLEVMLNPVTAPALEALAPVLEFLDGD